jgi:hypothetical protein
MNQKRFARILIVAFPFVAILIGISYFASNNKETRQESPVSIADIEQNEVEISNIYQNKKHDYELKYKKPWRAARLLSKEWAVSSIKLQLKMSNEEYYNCIAEHTPEKIDTITECLEILEPQLQEFRRNWMLNNSDVMLLTDLNEQYENDFVDKVRAREKVLTDYPDGHWVRINVGGVQVVFGRDSSKFIKFEDIILQNSLKVQQMDSRVIKNDEIVGGELTIMIPIKSDAAMSTGGEVTTLSILTNAAPDSQTEKSFYEIVESLILKSRN